MSFPVIRQFLPCSNMVTITMARMPGSDETLTAKMKTCFFVLHMNCMLIQEMLKRSTEQISATDAAVLLVKYSVACFDILLLTLLKRLALAIVDHDTI